MYIFSILSHFLNGKRPAFSEIIAKEAEFSNHNEYWSKHFCRHSKIWDGCGLQRVIADPFAPKTEIEVR